MAAKIFQKAQKMFNKGQGADDAADGTKEEDEGVAPRTRFADADPTAAGKKKPGSKKEVRVKEPPSEDGEEQKAKVTSIKKAGDKKGPPSVSPQPHVQSVIFITIFMSLLYTRFTFDRT